MTKSANKIWCPKCYKRHRLPDNADGMTLRCRGCKYAFRVIDGLKTDPSKEKESHVEQNVSAVLSVKPEARAKGRKDSSAQSANVGAGQGGSSGLAAESGTAILDNEYDDILSVLETPKEDALAQPRAIANRPRQEISVSQVPTAEEPEQPVREPVTRQQLRAHRNSRQFWMLFGFISACILGIVCWCSLNLVMDSSLSAWERKILYSFGVPARWLPPLAEGEEELLPPRRVILRGDHAELADRNDFFRDEFPAADVEVAEPKLADNERDGPRILNPNPRVPNNRRPNPRGGVGNVGRVPKNMGRRNDARNARKVWSPPELSASDFQMVAARGIDPKTLNSFSIKASPSSDVVFSGDTVFFTGSDGHLVAYSIANNQQIAHRKLKSDVASMCAAANDGISTRPAAWLLYGSGKLEKWEVAGLELNPVVNLKAQPVFKEAHSVVAAAKGRIAYVREGQIVISDFLPNASRISKSISVSVDHVVSAIQFSENETQLMAVAGPDLLIVNATTGEIEKKLIVPENLRPIVADHSQSFSISRDLRTVFASRNGVVNAYSIIGDQVQPSGQYWGLIPNAIQRVVAGGNRVLGIGNGKPAQATLFAMAEMEESRFVKTEIEGEAKLRERLLAENRKAPELPEQAYLKNLSPEFGESIEALKFVDSDHLVFLTKSNGESQVAVARMDQGWQVYPLNLQVDGNISRFSVSPDLKKIVVAAGEVVQSWSIDDLESGSVTLVSEFAGHLNPVTQLVLMPGGESVVSGDRKGKLLTWSFDNAKRLGSFSELRFEVTGLVAKSDAAFVAMDQSAVAKGSLTSLRGKVRPFGRSLLGATCFSQNGSRIAFHSANQIKVAGVSRQKIEAEIEYSGSAKSLQFTKSQRYLLLQDAQEVSLWDWRNEEKVRRFRLPGKSYAGAFSISNTDDFVAVVLGADSNQIGIFELPIDE